MRTAKRMIGATAAVFALLMAGDLRAQDGLLTDLESVLFKYAESMGGEDAVKAIHGVRAKGVIKTDTATYEIVLIKKRPYFKRMIRSEGDFVIDVGFDGEKVWRRIEQGERTAVMELTGAEAEGFIADNDFDGPLLGPPPAGTTLRLARTERIQRAPYYVVAISGPTGDSEVYIDARTMREYKTVQTIKGADGEPIAVEVVNSNYRKVGSMWVAMRMERFENGKRVAETILSDVEINPGVFNSFFSMPQ